MPTAAPSRPSRWRRYAAEVGRYLPVDDPAIYPVSGGSEAIETALKLARAYHLARGEPDALIVIAPVGELPRQHAGRAGPVAAARRCAARTSRGSAASATCPPPTRTAPASRARTRWPTGDELGRRAGARRSSAAGPGTVAAFVAEPIVGATLAAAVPPRRLLAGDRRGLRATRRPAHRRRGHDRVRADRALVRPRPLGRAARPAGRGQGRDVGLLAVRVRGGVGRGPRHGRPAPGAASSTASPTRTPRSGPRSPARSCASWRTRTWWRPARPRASGSRRPRAGDSASTRTSGRSAAAACWSGIELVADRETRAPFPRAAQVTEARRPRPRASAASWSTRGPATPNGIDGDTILLGPPFVVTDDELDRIADVVAEAVVRLAHGRGTPRALGRSTRSAPRRAQAPISEHQPPRPISSDRDEEAAGGRVRDVDRRRAARASRRTRAASPTHRR